ncbi:MAG TPA: hypothetical protein VK420_15265 [Longimicrobium sp.]|nr:hypothetical protein [Longimicrobium sp.]
MKQNRTIALTALAAVLLLGGCEGGTDNPPPVVPDNQFVVVRQASNAPALAAREATFWAKAGENAEVRIPYTTGENCLEFKIPGNGLLRRPDGTAFRRGDSIQITIRVLDATRFNFEFQPSGLRFDPGHPAELRMRYRYADPDLNGDGRVDGADDRSRLAIWRQEADGQPWVRTGTLRDAHADEVRADLQGFTKYAMASN